MGTRFWIKRFFVVLLGAFVVVCAEPESRLSSRRQGQTDFLVGQFWRF